jgi:hypothetical protein
MAGLGGAGLIAAYAIGCGDDDEESGEAAPTPLGATSTPRATPAATTPAAQAMRLVSGWYRDQQVKYYDFGMNSPHTGGSVATAPIYVLISGMNTDGTPIFVEGQHNIVDAVPGDAGYSDLWQVMLVQAGDDYEPDSIKSKAELDASGLQVTSTDMLVNCPIVPEGTTLEGGEELVQGWYKGEPVFYPDFGANPASAIPIWVFITGMDAQGNPQFVEGQHNIIDAVPSDAGYSAFWRVNLVTVATDYEPDSIKSASDVAASGYEIMQTDMAVNCPVTVF